ncbi:hypothetical protein C2S52_005544 [Perilla frutescens var. hirtella]|nr:hypothetical protein C2S52_005544 [Perilla frutescens var. hirtella]
MKLSQKIRLELKTKNKETSSPMETKLMILARRRGRYYHEFSANFPNQVCWQEERFAQFLGSNGVNDLLNTADTSYTCSILMIMVRTYDDLMHQFSSQFAENMVVL